MAAVRRYAGQRVIAHENPPKMGEICGPLLAQETEKSSNGSMKQLGSVGTSLERISAPNTSKEVIPKNWSRAAHQTAC